MSDLYPEDFHRLTNLPSSPFAKKLAKRLLSTGPDNIQCDRLLLMKKMRDGSERNYGGRCRRAVENVIDEAIFESGFIPDFKN
jgi:hypothetical protein